MFKIYDHDMKLKEKVKMDCFENKSKGFAIWMALNEAKSEIAVTTSNRKIAFFQLSNKRDCQKTREIDCPFV
jgi:hypothetical protein